MCSTKLRSVDPASKRALTKLPVLSSIENGSWDEVFPCARCWPDGKVPQGRAVARLLRADWPGPMEHREERWAWNYRCRELSYVQTSTCPDPKIRAAVALPYPDPLR